MMAYAKLICQYFFKVLLIIRQIIFNVPKLKNAPIFVHISDRVVSLYYYFFCGLSPCTVDLEDQSTMHFWISNHRRHDSANLVLIHGSGGDACWQFILQVRSLSKSFNIYMPDLLFYGKSYTNCMDRSPQFQAKCVMEGLKNGFGIKRCSVYSISYGGWVGYHMARMYRQEVEKIVIVSSGIGCTNDQKLDFQKQIKIPADEVFVPNNPEALRFLVKHTLHKYDLTWIPDYFLSQFIRAKENKNRMEKQELLRHLMSDETDSKISTLSQETLLVWGDHDQVFPITYARQLQRLLGAKARLEIIKDTGHAVNIESPYEINELIKSFILG